MAAPPVAPFRVRFGAGAFQLVLLPPGASEAGIERSIALRVGLAVGTFGIRNADGVPSPFHAGLAGDWEAVLLPAQSLAPAKRITLLVGKEDEFGELVESRLDMDVAAADSLFDLARIHGGGSLVLEGTAEATRSFPALVAGGVYALVGGQQEAVRRHRTWTQSSDKAFEQEATLAVRDAVAAEGGRSAGAGAAPQARLNCLVKNAAGKERELDGLVVCAHGTAAFLVEAKHSAQTGHVALVIEKARFLESAAREGGAGSDLGLGLGAVARTVVPVLAGALFAPGVLTLCSLSGVGVVKPNGRGLSYCPPAAATPPAPAPPAGLGAPTASRAAALRGLHTLARLLRR